MLNLNKGVWSIIPLRWLSTTKLASCFLIWSNPGLFFVYSFSYYNFNNTNWIKCTWCAWDLNHGQQICRCRRNHGAMAAANLHSFKKWANPGLFFIYFRSFSDKEYNFYNKSLQKIPCPSGMQTHNLLNMSRLPQPLDQGSRPMYLYSFGSFESFVRLDPLTAASVSLKQRTLKSSCMWVSTAK